MKRKLLLLTLIVALAAPSMMAQLTKGTPSADMVRTGNRAKAGDFGFYFGFYNRSAEDLFGSFDRQYERNRTPIPLVNMKYMVSNRTELRLGIELKKESMSYNYGDLIDPTDADSYKLQTKNTLTEVDNIITPGFAYHFSNSNILDVYVGAELPLGYTRTRDYFHSELDDDGDATYTKLTSMSYNIGLGAFLGVQAYIGNLPLAVGMEWGIYGRYNLNLKGMRESQANSNSDVVKEYITIDSDLENFSSLWHDEIKSARKFFAGNQLRFTITYFFNK